MNQNEYANKVIEAAAEATSIFLSGQAGASTLPELLNASVQKAVGTSIIESSDAIDPLLQHSVQSRAGNLWANAFPDGGLLNNLFYRQRTPTDVAPYGFLSRDIQMRQLFVLKGNDLIQSAVNTCVQKVQSTEWYIEGPKRTANFYTRLLQGSDLGLGWESFTSKTIQDFQTTDNGMFWELIWDDASSDDILVEPPSSSAQVIGIAHMDANRCRRTGDPDFPVLYQSLTGLMHRMHRTRVLYAADMPSSNERLLGRGFCALSRALSISASTVRFNLYREELLDDIPPLGLLILSGVNKAFWEANKKEFNSARQANEQFVFSNLMTLFSMDPSKPAVATMLPFKSLWDNFDEKQFWDSAIDNVAMAWGIDRQELAPINAASLGTGAQSSVLAQKARGKGIGNLLSTYERMINRLLPESCTFAFDFHDDEQDYQQAQLRNQKLNTIISAYTASSGNSKPTPTQKLKPLAGETTKAEQDAPPADEKPAETPNPADIPTGTLAPAPPEREMLVSFDEARSLLMHEIPEWADILSPSGKGDVMYDDTQQDAVFDPAETPAPAKGEAKKALQRYGPKVRQYHKSKKIKTIEQTKQMIARQQQPAILKLADSEIEDAIAYLQGLGIKVG